MEGNNSESQSNYKLLKDNLKNGNIRFVAGKAEALSRKGFFSGVATVCTKLFNIIRPDIVVFGRKDRLQCYVIQQVFPLWDFGYVC